MMPSVTLVDRGFVHQVTSTPVGSRLVGDHAAAVTVLQVADASDFTEDGGTLTVTSWDPVDSVWSGVQYTYTAADPDLDTVTLDPAGGGLEAAALDGDLVAVFPGNTQKTAQVLLADSGDAVTAAIPHMLSDLLEEGIREEYAREAVELTLVDYDWTISNMPGRAPALRSTTFAEGETGWALDDEGAQFENVGVTGELGADVLSGNRLTLNDRDLEADIIDPMPLGLIVHVVPPVGSNTAPMTAETIAFIVNVGSLYNNRFYRISYGGWVTAAAITDDVFQTQIRYAVTGAVPTLATNVLGRSGYRWSADAGTAPTSFLHESFYSPSNDYETVQFAWTFQRLAGTGSCVVRCDDGEFMPWLSVEDMGLQASVGGTISQKSKATPSGGTAPPPDADPVSTYTRSWTADDSRSYDADNGYRAGEPGTSNCYQGYYSATHGNTKSIVGFDDADIRAKLTGATVKAVKLTFRVRHAYYNAGLDVRVKDHNHSAPPSTYSAGAAVGSRNDCREGSTYTISLPVSFGTDLKNGNARGVSFYAPSKDRRYYGYLYGPGSGSAPKLTVTYSK